MLIFLITVTNLKFLTVINGGVTPAITSVDPTYLVMESGEVNRIITQEELLSSKYEGLEAYTRKFWVV